jgi:hypothetical protein
MSERIRIFSNGSEHDAWDERNCSQCALKPHENDLGVCDIFDAIIDSMVTDGAFSPEIAIRMGFRDACRSILGWQCAEFRDAPDGPRPAAHEVAAAGTPCLPGFDTAAQERAAAGGGAGS